MSIQILNRWTAVVLYSSETAQSIAGAVIEARKNGANLRGADLGGANLRGANLRGAKGLLPGGLIPLQIQGTVHLLIVREPGFITIGCEHHEIAWWEEYYAAVGRREKYTDAQVLEYRKHIQYAKEWMETAGVLADPKQDQRENRCAGNDPLCPCQDGDMCHYRGPNAWPVTAARGESQ